MNRPTFMILGSGKAGTTSLQYYLSQHPEVFISHPKEPVFFQCEYERGMEYYWDTYYRGYGGQRHAGEAAHQNLRLPYVTHRIAEAVPEGRFFVICRNPVERALSAYWHNVTRGGERRSFEEAIESNLERLERGPRFVEESEAHLYAEARERQKRGAQVVYASYIDSGYYAQHIERFSEAVGRERIKVLLFDDMLADVHSLMVDAFSFLDLEPIPLRDSRAQNAPVSPALAAVFSKIVALPGIGSVPLSWRTRVKRSLGVLFPSSKPEMRPETRRMLTEHFRPHNEHLSRLTGRNLDSWNEAVPG